MLEAEPEPEPTPPSTSFDDWLTEAFPLPWVWHWRHLAFMRRKLDGFDAGETDRILFSTPPRHGKALALDTLIPTPSGWATIGELRPGDQVFSETGEPCNVVAVSPVWRDRKVYRVTTDCGDSLVADAQHEWRVQLNGNGRGVWTIRTTEYLANRPAGAKAAVIEAQGALNLPESALPVDPYVLGIWLGDGRTNSGAICAADAEIVGEVMWREGGEASFYELRNGAWHFRPGPNMRDDGIKRWHTLQGRLKLIGVLGDKHIPLFYLRASESQRRELIQGLVDSDGYVAKDGQIEFCTTLKRLAFDVAELVASLGHKASLIEGRATLNGQDHGPKYRVMWYMSGAAKLKRKAERCRHGLRASRRYVRVTPAGRADTVCIEVDSPSHLFLAGRSMLPTHNSEQNTVRYPAYRIEREPDTRVIMGAHTSALAKKFSIKTRRICRARGVPMSRDRYGADDWETEAGGGERAVGVGGFLRARAATWSCSTTPYAAGPMPIARPTATTCGTGTPTTS